LNVGEKVTAHSSGKYYVNNSHLLLYHRLCVYEGVSRAVKMGRTIGLSIVLYGLDWVGFNKIYLGLIRSDHLNLFICLGPLGRNRAEPRWPI
jgi:hypothetical protein